MTVRLSYLDFGDILLIYQIVGCVDFGRMDCVQSPKNIIMRKFVKV